MVFQSYALFPHLTVAENILFGLRVRKVPAAERTRRLNRVAALLGLDALLERKPSQLSGGQQQRVALGRAIIAETPVCLMDEPLSNLDAQLRAEMRREIRALQQKLGITMVYVTHDQSEAMSMADRVILMRDGRVEQAAAPEDLYARPASTFAARFIGTPPMNILPVAPKRGSRRSPVRHPPRARHTRRQRHPRPRAERGISGRRYDRHLCLWWRDARGARARQSRVSDRRGGRRSLASRKSAFLRRRKRATPRRRGRLRRGKCQHRPRMPRRLRRREHV